MTDDLLDNLKENRQLTDSIISEKDRQIEALTKMVNQLVDRLEAYEERRTLPTSTPFTGVV